MIGTSPCCFLSLQIKESERQVAAPIYKKSSPQLFIERITIGPALLERMYNAIKLSSTHYSSVSPVLTLLKCSRVFSNVSSSLKQSAEWKNGAHIRPFIKLAGNFQRRRWTGLWTLLYDSHSAGSILWTLPELNLGTTLPLSNIFSYSAEIQASAQALNWPLPCLATIYTISWCKG